MSMSDVVELRDVIKEFPGIVAVEGINLNIPKGEFFTLLGPSGSGKTTILRLIAGLEQPTSGKIVIDGQDVTDVPPYKRDTATVFQNYALWPHMTVAENIGYGLQIRNYDDSEIEDRIQDLLDLVDLPQIGDRKVSTLSGGQQQRVALARALAVQPELLLLDEPLGALDEKLRQAMQVEMKEIQEETGTTFLYVTHNQEEALSMSDRVAIINDANLVQMGTPKEVYTQPQTEFIASFFRDSNIFSGVVSDVSDTTFSLSFSGSTITAKDPRDFSVNCGEQVKFFIGAENIDPNGARPNKIRGTIANSVYLGSEVVYTVEVGDVEFTVTVTEDRFTVGEDLTLTWDPEDTILLRE